MYLAHISDDTTKKQTISEHLKGTAELAAAFSDVFHCREWGYGCGILHDIGKYSIKFQQRLAGGPITDHATAGARELYQQGNYLGAYCIAGHHSGLLDGGSVADVGGTATLRGRMQKACEDYQAYQTEICMPKFPPIPLKPLGNGGFSMAFFIRMLFSCLVDADYLDTEAFMTQETVQRGDSDSIEVLYNRVYAYIEPWLAHKEQHTVNGRRSTILRACLEAGKRERSVFQLTVPTGGGKTVSSLAFGLKHALQHQMDRVIYVIPYTSIIEQNAKVFQDILGKQNVLEDHCNVNIDDVEELKRAQLAAENWDCPVVVTTNVQFFESLFACKTSKCRKLHNIANSVIVFDEAQMLPVNYIKPCIQAMSELVYNYKCTAVLCTATQPALHSFFPPQLKIREICPEVEQQYDFFRRTVFHKAGKLTEEELCLQLKEHKQVLCILNSRKRVQRICEALEEEEGVFQLSTLLYPKHRRKMLKAIKERLLTGKDCKVIATSLVEAGVDFDFPAVYRELAGLDSLIQAAGRCNREGKRQRECSQTTVFTLEKSEDCKIPQALKQPIAVAGQILEHYEDIASLKAIEDYFKQLYHFKGEGLDSKEIVREFEEGAKSFTFPFATAARRFRLIENETRTILITRDPEAQELAGRINRGECSRQLVRDAGQYCINLYENDFHALQAAGLLEAIPMEFYLLRNPEQYSWEKGLIIKAERGDAVIF